ncbi:MAG: septum formation initiator family protein [Desulfovibrionaceae bacterium]|nr:septum formation initiator family protein [Desulfovibrionaceae bacterium]
MDKSASPVSFFWKSAILALALFMNLTLAFRLLWGDQSVVAWRALKARLGQMTVELRDLDKRRADLSREIRLLQTDDSYVEKMIRQRLNYVRGNEILYLFDEAAPENSAWAGAGNDDEPQ